MQPPRVTRITHGGAAVGMRLAYHHRHEEARPPRVDDTHHGRRLQQRLHEGARSGYYTARVCFGTPPRPFDLIVDTGSFMTSVPCASCKHCGVHTSGVRGRFDSRASSSAKECHKNATRGGRPCTYSMAYTEGSTISGSIISDVTRFAQHKERNLSRKTVGVRAYFGCQTHEGGLLYAQRADGILGMTKRGHPGGHMSLVRHELVRQHASPDVFSLCLSTSSGLLLLGGRVRTARLNAARARGAVLRVPMSPDPRGRYALRLAGIYAQKLPAPPTGWTAGGTAAATPSTASWFGRDRTMAFRLAAATQNASTPFVQLAAPTTPAAARPSGKSRNAPKAAHMHVLIDSGTSDAYLPMRLWAPLHAYLRAQLIVAGALTAPGEGRPSCVYLTPAQLDELPRLQVRFADVPNQPLLVRPQQYMVLMTRRGIGALAPNHALARYWGVHPGGVGLRERYCLAVHPSGEIGGDENTAVLGAALFRGYEVLFEAAASGTSAGASGGTGAISFVPTDCDATTPATSMLDETYTFEC